MGDHTSVRHPCCCPPYRLRSRFVTPPVKSLADVGSLSSVQDCVKALNTISVKELPHLNKTIINCCVLFLKSVSFMYNTSRIINRSIPRLSAISSSLRPFHTTSVKMVKPGDAIPSIELYETTPGTKVDLSKELKGKGIIIGVPAAFSEFHLKP